MESQDLQTQELEKKIRWRQKLERSEKERSQLSDIAPGLTPKFLANS
ncbi:hypothetical protein [Microseira wollei]|uniref:Uncharacterized protein n=1 Tax=Microseira wollei NIES-4236 TaxID=2530354 RepID=A0AAV3X684_9CYAN|nr:hypothetical protein [Microseira wollei]GET36751.1 hypothetical protein MiSe_15030 [Microseira wollei NIES-4236]